MPCCIKSRTVDEFIPVRRDDQGVGRVGVSFVMGRYVPEDDTHLSKP